MKLCGSWLEKDRESYDMATWILLHWRIKRNRICEQGARYLYVQAWNAIQTISNEKTIDESKSQYPEIYENGTNDCLSDGARDSTSTSLIVLTTNFRKLSDKAQPEPHEERKTQSLSSSSSNKMFDADLEVGMRDQSTFLEGRRDLCLCFLLRYQWSGQWIKWKDLRHLVAISIAHTVAYKQVSNIISNTYPSHTTNWIQLHLACVERCPSTVSQTKIFSHFRSFPVGEGETHTTC